MAKVIAFGKSTICLFKSNKHLISCSHSCFSSFLWFWNICRTKVPEVPSEGRDPLLQKQTQNETAHQWDQKRNVTHSTVSVQLVYRAASLPIQTPHLWTHPSLDRRRGTTLKSIQKVWKIVTCLTSCLCKDFTVKRAEGPNRSEHVEVLLCWPKRFREAKPGLLQNFFLYAVNY